jgi:hypothetical protein
MFERVVERVGCRTMNVALRARRHLHFSSRVLAVLVAVASLLGGIGGAASAGPSSQWAQRVVFARAQFIDSPLQPAGSKLVYGLVPVPDSFRSYRVQVLDLATRRRRLGPLVYSGADLVLVGRGVAVVEPGSPPAAGHPASPVVLHFIDGRDGGLGPAVGLAAAGSSFATLRVAPADPAGELWVATGKYPLLLSTTTGKALRRLQALAAPVNNLAVSPDGHRVYAEVSSDVSPVVANTVEELDAVTRVVVATRQLPTANAVVEAPTTAGVWVITSSGMTDEVLHLSAAGLVPSAECGQVPGCDPYIGVVKLLGGVAWLVSSAGVACADPAGQSVRGGEWFAGVAQTHNFGGATNPFVPIAVLGGVLYATRGNGSGSQPGDVVAVTAPLRCWDSTSRGRDDSLAPHDFTRPQRLF